MPARSVDESLAAKRLPSASIKNVLTGLAFAIGGLLDIGSSAVQAKDCEENELGRVYESLPAPYGPTTEEEIVHTRIGGRNFYVPKNYFRHPQVGCGAEESGMLLRVLLPDLKPYSEETKAEFEAQRGFGLLMNILLSRPSGLIDLDEVAELWVKDTPVEPPSEATHGLSHAVHQHGDDIFFARIERRVVFIIRCSPILPGRGSGCLHLFQFREHRLKLTYGRQHLPAWRSIQPSAKSLIESFDRSPRN